MSVLGVASLCNSSHDSGHMVLVLIRISLKISITIKGRNQSLFFMSGFHFLYLCRIFISVFMSEASLYYSCLGILLDLESRDNHIMSWSVFPKFSICGRI